MVSLREATLVDVQTDNQAGGLVGDELMTWSILNSLAMYFYTQDSQTATLDISSCCHLSGLLSLIFKQPTRLAGWLGMT
jgi:hypothetical protein